MGSGVREIERLFSERGARWGVRLPADSVINRQPGHIFEAGWHIGYVWGQEGGEEFLEYLAQHRMTSDVRERIWASGRVEDLPVPDEFFWEPKDASEAEIKLAEQAYFDRNRRLFEELHAKGLLPPEGENIPLTEINEYLRSGRMADTEPPPGAD